MVLMAEKFRIVGSGKWAVESASNTGPNEYTVGDCTCKEPLYCVRFLDSGSYCMNVRSCDRRVICAFGLYYNVAWTPYSYYTTRAHQSRAAGLALPSTNLVGTARSSGKIIFVDRWYCTYGYYI